MFFRFSKEWEVFGIERERERETKWKLKALSFGRVSAPNCLDLERESCAKANKTVTATIY